MVDIHSHILFATDDGPATLEDSLAMVQVAAGSGTTDIVASAHRSDRYRFEPAVVEGKLAELREAAGGAIRIHYGCELHLTLENVHDVLLHPRAYSINHGVYLLVELAEFLIAGAMSAVFARMWDRGLRPIVAHPERHPLLRKRIPEVATWVREGCFVQITAQSLTGAFGTRTQAASRELLRCGLVHFVASDAHDCINRPPVLEIARRQVAHECGEETAALLFEDNARAALTGGAVAAPGCTGRRRTWFAF